MNVVHAIKAYGPLVSIVLTGPDRESKLARLDPDAIIHVDHPDIRVQEDVHLAICHAIAGMLKEEADEKDD